MTPKPIKERQAHLKTIGEALLNARELSTEQREFIGNALIGISEGAEPKEQLDLKAKRGERTSLESHKARTQAQNRKHMVSSWMFIAMQSIQDGGLGMTFDEAAGTIGENQLHAFGLTEETIKSYWGKNPKLRIAEFYIQD